MKNYILLSYPDQVNCLLKTFSNMGVDMTNYQNLPRILGVNMICGIDVYQLVSRINQVVVEYGMVDLKTVDEIEAMMLGVGDVGVIDEEE